MPTLVDVQRSGPIARLSLNRPHKRNALDDALVAELAASVESLRDAADLRVLIVSGAGPAFCAGVDVSELRGIADAEERRRIFTPIALRRTRMLARALDALRALNALSIAAVNGAAAGGGFSLMLACDFRIVTEDAKCWFPEVELGVPLSPTSTALLLDAVTPAVAREIILGGARLDAKRLASLGLAHAIVAPDALDSAATTLAERLASLAPAAAAVSKATINALARGGSVLRSDLLVQG